LIIIYFQLFHIKKFGAVFGTAKLNENMFKFKETVELRLIGAQQQHKVLKREVKKRLINKA